MNTSCIPTVLVILLMFPGQVYAAEAAKLMSQEEHEKDCIADMKLSEEQLQGGLFQYEIDRCAQYRIKIEGSRQHLERLQKRQQRFYEQRRERQRILSTVNTLRFRATREGNLNARTARAISRRAIREAAIEKERGGLSFSEARKHRALLRRERAKEAREACRTVAKSFYPNCVRQKYRSLGQGQGQE